VAWDKPALTRKERAEKVKKHNYFAKYGEAARKVIDALLDKYADEGIENIENLEVLRVEPFNTMGTPTEIVQLFGSRDKYLRVINELEKELYAVV
jgi:type I restriction enzyme, R subunit